MTENGRNDARHGADEHQDALGRLIARAGRRPDPPELIEAQVRAAVRNEWRSITDRRRRRSYMIVAAAAAIAFVAVGLGVLRQLPDPGALEPIGEVVRTSGDVRFIEPDEREIRVGAAAGESLCAKCEVATAPDSGVNLLIAGGASVRVGAATHVAWSGPQRVRLLAGSIYVDAPRQVASPRRETGPSSAAPAIPPLTIETDYGRVSHVGTQFAVMVAPSGLTVRVREGTVLLDAPRSRQVARTAEQLVIDRHGELTRSRIAPYGASWGWVEALAGDFDVTGRSLLEFLQWVSRETGRPVRFATAQLQRDAATVILQGTTRGMTVIEALDSVMATTNFRAILADGYVVVAVR